MQDAKLPGLQGGDTPDRSSSHNLRHLDFDDLFLLSHLLSGKTIAATARQLGLTQPAVTQRVRKIERVFEEQILQKVGRHVRLTREGQAICHRAGEALKLMRDVREMHQKGRMTIGAPHDLSRIRLLPSLVHGSAFAQSLQIHCGSSSELAKLLETGEIQAMLTTQEVLMQGVSRNVIGEDELLLLAKPDVADRIVSVDDLTELVFLETDSSMPHLNMLPAKTKLELKLQQVRFLGGYSNILAFLQQQESVALVPVSVAKALIEAGALKSIELGVELASQTVSLYIRDDRIDPVDAEHLIGLLKKN